jgi:hypothetical protein
MAWFLALQGPPNKSGQSPTYELHESADIEQIAREMSDSAAADRAVAVPAVFHNRRQKVTLYVRPAAWGAWAFYEMTEEERREMMAANPVVNALAQAQAQKQQQQPRTQQQQQQPRPQQPPGPSTLPRLS